MRVSVSLPGVFRRIPLDSFPTERIELENWLASIYQVAADVEIYSRQRIRSSFGLQFLSPAGAQRLLSRDGFPDRPDAGASPTFYEYRFSDGDREISLSPADRQIPEDWPFGVDSVEGRYQYEIDRRNPSVHDVLLDRIARQYWNDLTPSERIRLAFHSGRRSEFLFSLPEHPTLTALAELTDLSTAEREALQYLHNPDDLSTVSQEARDLIGDYYNDERPDIPDDIEPNFSNDLDLRLVIGRGNSRAELEKLIDSATTFLFVSSYVIEDESIATLIARKTTTLPGGAWILTDINDRMIDRDNSYRSVIDKKKICLSLLLTAGAHIRGGSFHLKSIVTEKEAYLGSSNLTGGSLDYNLEAGIIGQGTFHRDLYRYFLHCWRVEAEYDFSSGRNSFIRRDLVRVSSSLRFQSSCLFEEANYRQDLLEELNRSPDRVTIYSRGIQCDRELFSLLRYRPVNIHVDISGYSRALPLVQHSRRGQHAKVTLLDNRIAYIGGINFFFDGSDPRLKDVMYKITDPSVVSQIRQLLSSNF